MHKSKGMSSLAILIWVVTGWTLLTTVLVVPALILDGFVVTKLWVWFVLPTFASAPTLHLGVAVGLSLLANFLTRQYNFDYKPESETRKDLVGKLGFLYIGPSMVLFLGWIVSFWA